MDRFLDSLPWWGRVGLLEVDLLAAMRNRAETIRESGRLLDLGRYG